VRPWDQRSGIPEATAALTSRQWPSASSQESSVRLISGASVQPLERELCRRV